jgi:hypothetical protein
VYEILLYKVKNMPPFGACICSKLNIYLETNVKPIIFCCLITKIIKQQINKKEE